MRRSIANTLQSLPDAELMLRVGQGEHEAYEVLYERHARRLGGFFLRMLAYDTAKAEDMVQELFARVWTHRASYRAAQPFATWLYAMAYNLCKNDYRHEEVRQSYTAECMLREEPTITTPIQPCLWSRENSDYLCISQSYMNLSHKRLRNIWQNFGK